MALKSATSVRHLSQHILISTAGREEQSRSADGMDRGEPTDHHDGPSVGRDCPARGPPCYQDACAPRRAGRGVYLDGGGACGGVLLGFGGSGELCSKDDVRCAAEGEAVRAVGVVVGGDVSADDVRGNVQHLKCWVDGKRAKDLVGGHGVLARDGADFDGGFGEACGNDVAGEVGRVGVGEGKLHGGEWELVKCEAALSYGEVLHKAHHVDGFPRSEGCGGARLQHPVHFSETLHAILK